MNLITYGLLQVIFLLVLMGVYTGDAAPHTPFRTLIPFPRIGRRDTSHTLEDSEKTDGIYYTENKIRRNGNKNINTGLWFGPRLGRVQKRQNYLDDAMGYLLLRDLSSFKHTPKYIPRLGRESDELFEELNENNQTSY